MKTLVAGASGLIGREVARCLKASGHFVRSLSRDPKHSAPLRGLVDDVRLADATVLGSLAGICDDMRW